MWWLNCNHKRFIKLVVEGRTRDIFFWGGVVDFFFVKCVVWCCGVLDGVGLSGVGYSIV